MSPVHRSLFAVAALSLCVAACRDEKTEKAASAAPSAADEPVDPAARNADPVFTKTYRLEECYFASLSFHQARSAYLGSLGGGEPGPGKIPDFAVATDEAPPARPGTAPGSASAAPGASSSARPLASAVKPAPSPKASASAALAPSAAAEVDAKGKPLPPHRIRTVRYEYYARLCKTAAGIKTPPAPEVDQIVEDFTGYALGLAKDLTDANLYYEKEDYKADNFARGKDMHVKLVNDFKALDGQESKLYAAIQGFEQKSQVDKSGWAGSQKLGDALLMAGREVYLDLDSQTAEPAKVKADIAALDAANEALAVFAKEGENAQDPFVLILTQPGNLEAGQAHAIVDGHDTRPSSMIALGAYFGQILAGDYRATLKQLRPGGTKIDMGDGKMMVHPRLPNGRMVPLPPPT